MPTDQRERLARIRRFDQLVAYLRDGLGWPIDSDDFEELTFEYTPEELGIDSKNAAKIQEIKRLRPLVPGQPWGIFFVKFEPKRLPVVALRRILGQVALKKRASANRSERQAWAADDLLFVSNYGEGEERRIAFAHFSKPQDGHDLPTLKVLGWDNLDTPLHLDAVARELTDHLTWPDDEGDPDAWRKRWRAAFKLRHREVVTTSRDLSERLAELARAIRDRTRTALAIETETGPLTKLMKAFQTALVHDLDEAGFADMYAQTIAYGLLSARITDPERRSADDLAAHMRTNPFLKELLETFLHVGGRRGKAGGPEIDFDELGVSEVVELLDEANMDAVIRDFGDRNPQEDPVIHFYEHFLAAYDKKQKVKRGVFYTPRPLVSYIVRSVDELLRSEFGLTHGLADTTAWGEIVKRRKELKIPEGTPSGQAFVQILDPATGTGTFLVEVIDLIHKTMVEEWKAQGRGERTIEALWNEYVPKDLLPRLHGYELLMAPYAIAHLKIGLKLYETGYRFDSDQRARVYLTNALDPPGDKQLTLGFLPALAHEAEAVNEIKRKRRFTVVIGNPPYSILSGNLASVHRALVDRYRYVDGERIRERGALQFEKNIQDDYVKFFAVAEDILSVSSAAVLGYVSNGNYLDASTLRGLRASLCNRFHLRLFTDLHGDGTGAAAEGSRGEDENVFEIKQGVAVGLYCNAPGIPCQTRRIDVGGTRSEKYGYLSNGPYRHRDSISLKPQPPSYEFVARDLEVAKVWTAWNAINDLFRQYSAGIITARDHVVIARDRSTLIRRIRKMRDSELPDAAFLAEFDIPRKKGWDVATARVQLRAVASIADETRPIAYRPFDNRLIFYHQSMVWGRAFPTMQHMVVRRNLAIAVCKQLHKRTDPWAHVFVCNTLGESSLVSNKSKEVTSFFPMVLDTAGSMGLRHEDETNLGGAAAKFSFEESPSSAKAAESLLAYTYAVLHSPTYRVMFVDSLAREFPRIPASRDHGLASELCGLGMRLIRLHLIESPKLDQFITTYTGPRLPEVGRVGWSDGTVWLDAGKTNARKGYRAVRRGTIGFKGVPEQVWDFQIGGYQVCHKWLKDRKGRTLSDEDVAHYQKIVVALNETIRIMAEIDEVIKSHGGWPDAFQAGSEADAASEGTAKVVPFRPRTVEPAPQDRYVTCVPLVPLKAAAGGFSGPQHVEDDDFEWVAVESRHRLRKGMFVAQVVGRSMEPAIRDGAWCLFRAPVEGTRQGRIILVQLRDATDPETGQRYTVKRYKSEKAKKSDSWRHEKITLEPGNPVFAPILLTGADEGEFHVVAELVEVLERKALSAETDSR